MRKISLISTLIGLISLLFLFIYTGLNLSRILPLLTLISFFLYLFLGGILSILTSYSNSKNIKIISFLTFIISFVIMLIFPSAIITLENRIKIEIGLISISYILILYTLLKKVKI
jgi:hypothetical protein